MPHKLYHTLLLVAIFLMPFATYAGVLKGSIKDANGDPLPFATVYVKGTTMGTAANEAAQYQLQLPVGTYTVVCQYMGFTQDIYKVTIKGNEHISHNFTLREQSLRMNSVVVKAGAEDPAYAIIRKAIKKRKAHLNQIKEFQTDIYMKGVVRNRSIPNSFLGIKINNGDEEMEGADEMLGIWYLCEEEAKYYAKKGDSRTIIKSVRESGDPNGFGVAEMPPVISFYENNVSLIENMNPRGFISPISDNAIFYYKYKYEGDFEEAGHIINKIKVIPRRKFEPLFSGYIYIVDKDWAIHSLDLLLTRESNMSMMDTFSIQQVYLPMAKDTWVIKEQVWYPTLSLLGFDLSGYLLTVYDNQEVNGAIPDSIFGSKIISSYASDAIDKDTSYWNEKRPIVLNEEEKADYKEKDSLNAYYQSPEYKARQDSLRRKANRFKLWDVVLPGFTLNTKEYKHRIYTNSLLKGMLGYNTIEGLRIAPQIEWIAKVDSSKSIRTSAVARYGIGNTRFNAMAKTTLTIKDPHWASRKWDIGIEGGKYIFQYNARSTVTPLYNTYTTLVNGNNYVKMYERWTASVFASRNYGNGFSWDVKAGYQKRLPLQNTTFYTWAPSDKVNFTDNVPNALGNRTWEEHDAVLVKAMISFQPGYRYIQYPKVKQPVGSSWPRFTLYYEKGIPGILNSKTDFDKWSAGISDEVNMKLLGSISYNLTVGGFLNTNYVSLPDMMHLADNKLLIAAPYLQSFQLASYYDNSNIEPIYGELHLEYNLNGLLTNKLPIWRRTLWELVLGTNTFYAGPSNYYTEAFVGVDNIGYKLIRPIRIDLVHSWDSFNKTNIGIRIGLDMSRLPISLGGRMEDFKW